MYHFVISLLVGSTRSTTLRYVSIAEQEASTNVLFDNNTRDLSSIS